MKSSKKGPHSARRRRLDDQVNDVHGKGNAAAADNDDDDDYDEQPNGEAVTPMATCGMPAALPSYTSNPATDTDDGKKKMALIPTTVMKKVRFVFSTTRAPPTPTDVMGRKTVRFQFDNGAKDVDLGLHDGIVGRR